MWNTKSAARILATMLVVLPSLSAGAADTDRPTTYLQKRAGGPWELYSTAGDGRQAGNPGRVCAYGIERAACYMKNTGKVCEPHAIKFVGKSGKEEVVKCVGSGASAAQITEGLRRGETLK